MTDKFLPSGDAALIPALPNEDVDEVDTIIEGIRANAKRRAEGCAIYFCGVDLDCAIALADEIKRLRALVPSSDSQEIFIAAIRTLREQCRVDANCEASATGYRNAKFEAMNRLDEALQIIDVEPSALVPSSQPETPTERTYAFAKRHELAGRLRKLADGLIDSAFSQNDVLKPAIRKIADELSAPMTAALPVVQDEAPKADTVAIEAVLAKHWLFELRCNHELKTDQAVCACGVYRGKDELSVGAAVRSWAKHVTAEIAAALGASGPSPADRKEQK